MTFRSDTAEVAYNGGDVGLVDELVDEVENDRAPVVDLLLQVEQIEAGDVRLDELGVRRLLRRLAYLQRESETLIALKRGVTAKYDEAIATRTSEASQIRGLLQVHLERVDGGKVLVPDVGTAFLARRQPKVEVVDREAFLEWAREQGHVKEAVDEAAARAAATAAVVNNGEVAPPGLAFVPERREPNVRWAA